MPRDLARALRGMALAAALLMAAAGSAQAATLTFEDVSPPGGRFLFKPTGVAPETIRSARVLAGSSRRRLPLRSVRLGVRRGILRVADLSHGPRAARRRAKLRLVVTGPPAGGPRPAPGPAPGPAPAPAPVSGRLAGFETRDFSELDVTGMRGGTIQTTSERAYEGSVSARATYGGDQGSAFFQRTAYDVSWGEGSDVWYGAAFFIPDFDELCWWNPIRWDNYPTYESGGDVGGLHIANGKLYLARATFAREQHDLIGPLDIPEGRWFWVEVHQRLSARDGQAVSEVYLDGRLTGSSTRANSMGRVVNRIHYGIVAMATECSRAGSIYMDRVSVSNRPRGPVTR